jgi:hypothetical protein
MGVKYTIPYKSIDNKSWRIDISLATWTATPIQVRAAVNQAGILQHTPEETDNPFNTLYFGEFSTTLKNQGQIDVRELQQATDRQFKASVYCNNQLKFTGYVIPDGIQRQIGGTLPDVQLRITDGLNMLDDIPYTHNNLFGTGDTLNRCLMNYFRQILFADSNLALPLPIRWTNGLECTAFPGEDVFTGGVRWSPRGEGFYDPVSKQYRSCGYILRGLLKAMQCQIKQVNGEWVIRRIPDLVSGYVPYKSTPASLDRIIVNTGVDDLRRLIGRQGYMPVDNYPITINRPGLKSFKTTYEADVKENILPNGNFDLAALGIVPLYWGSIPPGPGPGRQDIVTSTTVDSLDGRGGYAVKLETTGRGFWGLLNNIPVDSFILLKKIDFSFLFSPVTWITNTDGTLDFQNSPFQLTVAFKVKNTQYYLNNYGYWTTDYTNLNIEIPGLKVGEVAQVKFDKFQGIIMPAPDAELQPGDDCEISINFTVDYLKNQSYILDNISISIDSNNDIYETVSSLAQNTATEETTLQISSSFGGYMVSNLMSDYSRSDEEFQYKDGDYYTGSLTGLNSNAVMRFRHKPSELYSGAFSTRGNDYSFDAIYIIDGIFGVNFLPLSDSWNTETCEVNISAMECRNDNVIFTEKFYGSNTNTLSN